MKTDKLLIKIGGTVIVIISSWIIGRLERGYFAFGAEALITVLGVSYIVYEITQYFEFKEAELDFLKDIIQEQKNIIEDLRQYISFEQFITSKFNDKKENM